MHEVRGGLGTFHTGGVRNGELGYFNTSYMPIDLSQVWFLVDRSSRGATRVGIIAPTSILCARRAHSHEFDYIGKDGDSCKYSLFRISGGAFPTLTWVYCLDPILTRWMCRSISSSSYLPFMSAFLGRFLPFSFLRSRLDFLWSKQGQR